MLARSAQERPVLRCCAAAREITYVMSDRAEDCTSVPEISPPHHLGGRRVIYLPRTHAEIGEAAPRGQR